MDVSVDGVSGSYEIQNAVELMHAHYGEKISVSSLACKANRSESHFARLFKQEMGFSPAEYLMRIRVEKARKLLSHSQKNASEIALECGFASSAHFSYAFKKRVGVSPLQYRRNFK